MRHEGRHRGLERGGETRMWKTCGQLVEHLWRRRGREEKFRAPRQSIRRFPACGRTSILCSLDRRRAIARIPLRHTGFDLLDHDCPTHRPTHPWPRLSRRGDAGRFRAVAGARDQRPRRSDGPDAVLRHHRRSGRDPAHRLAVPRAQAGRSKPAGPAPAPAPAFHDPGDGASPPPPPPYRTGQRPGSDRTATGRGGAGAARRSGWWPPAAPSPIATGARLSPAELVRLAPAIERHARIEVEAFANVSSGQLTLDQWLQLARRVSTILADDDDYAGVVVTSGTDTLEELAYFLHLTVRSDKPVVVVGSMRPPDAVTFDGAANLVAAVRVAAAAESRGRGTLVVMNEEIHGARDVTKTDAQRLDAFQSPWRTARHRRRGSRGLRAPIGEARRSADGVRRADAVDAAAGRRAADVPGRARRSHPRRGRQRRRRHRHRHRRRRNQRHPARGAALRDQQARRRRHGDADRRRPRRPRPAIPDACSPCPARSPPRT